MSESRKANMNTNSSDDVYDVPLNADSFLNNISITPMPINTTSKYIHASALPFTLGERCLPQGIEQIIAAKQTMRPILLDIVRLSPNQRKADSTGINNDKRCAISVRTIPLELTETATMTNNAGNRMPSIV